MFWSLWLAVIIYCATFMLGIGISLSWWRTHSIRWLHHALFGGIWVSISAATLVAFLDGIARWYVPLAVLLWMVPLPLLRPGRIGHRVLAVGGLVTFVGVLWIVEYS